jgi:hypothetical protein
MKSLATSLRHWRGGHSPEPEREGEWAGWVLRCGQVRRQMAVPIEEESKGLGRRRDPSPRSSVVAQTVGRWS